MSVSDGDGDGDGDDNRTGPADAVERADGSEPVVGTEPGHPWLPPPAPGQPPRTTRRLPPAPRSTRLWLCFVLGLGLAAAVAYLGYPAWVGNNLRIRDAPARLILVAALCGVIGLAAGVGLDAAALRRTGRHVGNTSPWAWAFSVLLLAIAAVPTYLYQRARTTAAGGSRPDGPVRPVLGALAGVGAVVMISVVVVVASARAPAAFGVPIDPAKIETSIAGSTPANRPLAAAGVTNVRCDVPGLVQGGDTFTCTERVGDRFGVPSLRTTTTTLLLGPTNSAVVPTTASTITYTVTVTDDDGSVTWRRTTPTTR